MSAFWYVALGVVLGAGIAGLAITWFVGRSLGAIVAGVLKELGVPAHPGEGT